MTGILDFITELTYDDIPASARQTARLCLLDTLGCMISGMAYAPIRNLASTIAASHAGTSAIAATGLKTSRAWAAFANTHAATFFDLDDGHRKAQGHPGGVIIPLSLMLAAETGAGGKELITAIVGGYETAVRSALIMRRAGGPRKGSGAWSVTGGAAAAASLCGLSKQQLKNALGLAEYYAPQAPQDRSLQGPSSMKEGMAWAAFTAMNTVELARAGLDAMDPFLMDAGVCADLGTRWEIESVYFKQYACCRFSHPVLDGLSALVDRYTITHDQVASITIYTFEKGVLLGRTAPEHPVAAMYSIPFAVGARLVHGDVTPERMGLRELRDPRVLETASKVGLKEDIRLTQQFPEKCLARMRISLKDGTIHESPILSAKGDPDNPFSRDELKAKFFRLTHRLSERLSKDIMALALNIEKERPETLWTLLLNIT